MFGDLDIPQKFIDTNFDIQGFITWKKYTKEEKIKNKDGNEEINQWIHIYPEFKIDKLKSKIDFIEYIEKIKDMGYSTDEAIKIVGNLAKEQQNAEIYQQALKRGFEETTQALDDYNTSLLETIDLTSILLGDGASE